MQMNILWDKKYYDFTKDVTDKPHVIFDIELKEDSDYIVLM